MPKSVSAFGVQKGMRMTFNRSYIGRDSGLVGPYEVSREKIRDYAYAISELHPYYLDPGAARAAGYRDVIAPPSFAVMLFFRFGGWPLYEPEFGKKAQPVCVHRAQSVDLSRSICPGDLLWQRTTVTDVYQAGPHDQFDMTHLITDAAGGTVAVVKNSIISRHVASLEQAV